MRRAWCFAWFRFRATFGRRWGGLLAVVLLLGLVGGLAMGAVAGARRTESSFPAFLASTNPSDLTVLETSGGLNLLGTMSRLPHVQHVRSAVFVNALPLGSNGAPVAGSNSSAGGVFPLGSVDGLFFDQDRVSVIRGRMADPRRADEAVMSADAARVLGIRVGQTGRLGFYTNAESNSPAYGTRAVVPVRTVDVKLVGIVVFPNEVVRDDVDRFPTYVLYTPALTRQILGCCASGLLQGLQLDRGSHDTVAVEREIGRTAFNVSSVASTIEAKAERAIKPEGIALGVFGAITALAALLIVGQIVGRQLRVGSDDLEVLRALGAGTTMTTIDGLFGIAGAVVVGSLFAVVVAIGLSRLAPIGPVRRVDPSPGIAFDWTVLAGGVLVLLVGLLVVAFAHAYRQAPHRAARRSATPRRSSRLAHAAASSGLPVPAMTGIRFALEPGRGRNVVPVRSAIVGAVLAVVVLVGTLTFAASLTTLVSHPALYGWNWNYELVSGYGGISNIPQTAASRQLDHDPSIAAWSGAYVTVLELDGQPVPALAMSPDSPVAPPQLSGHGVQTEHEIVLGATTLAQLHKYVGDTVTLTSGANTVTPTRLVIVGTATLPAIGAFGSFHFEMATGAVLADTLLPTAARGLGVHDGPEGIFVRFRQGANPTTALRSLKRVAASLNTPGDGPVSVVGLQRPAEIVNYRTVGTTPALLGVALATGAVIALGLTLLASVRRRRRDLALLKTLGFTHRQLAATIAWQASIAVALGVIIGVPAGIILGRTLWDLFARTLHVVPEPTVPTLTIATVAIGALILGNLVAAIPGIQAARTQTAVLLHAE